MRSECKIPVKVKKKVIGGEMPLICLPIVSGEKEVLIREAADLISLNPDLLEWRIDGFDRVRDIKESLVVLEELTRMSGSIPLIFTCRIDSEGGLQKLPREVRLNLITQVLETGLIDIVDIELCNDDEFIDLVLSEAGKHKAKVILSYHDFEKTPSTEFILDKLAQAQKKGADIAKLAAMPNSLEDVLTLMQATLKAREGVIDIPVVTMSMGEKGLITRVAGGVFGSDITFAMGKTSSAPGQVPIAELRNAMNVLYSRP